MKVTLTACAFLLGALSATPALANMCLTDSGRRTCGTGMPIGGYCMCGNEGGTVMPPGGHDRAYRPPPPDRPPPPPMDYSRPPPPPR
ncbi:MAG TPA: hypothetical protein VH023_15450 [Rhodopila sp.]|jgi:hypothetical protein|nr:hypothetical protein [Rhodopila sp.]